jgi:hypothetical protein
MEGERPTHDARLARRQPHQQDYLCVKYYNYLEIMHVIQQEVYMAIIQEPY